MTCEDIVRGKQNKRTLFTFHTFSKAKIVYKFYCNKQGISIIKVKKCRY